MTIDTQIVSADHLPETKPSDPSPPVGETTPPRKPWLSVGDHVKVLLAGNEFDDLGIEWGWHDGIVTGCSKEDKSVKIGNVAIDSVSPPLAINITDRGEGLLWKRVNSDPSPPVAVGDEVFVLFKPMIFQERWETGTVKDI